MSWPERLAANLHRHLAHADAVAVHQAHAFGNGASNATIGIELEICCEGRSWRTPLVLRPQREHGLLQPYDVSRQFRIMRALASSEVPAPAVMFHEQDAAVIGAPFFLMERVEGWAPPFLWYDPAVTEVEACATALAQVHHLDWEAAGLNWLRGATHTPVSNELRSWRVRAESHGIADHPLLVRLGAWLLAHEPTDSQFALLHGDPNPGNYLLDGGRVRAVIDWELADLGDPRSDLGFYASMLTVFGGRAPLDGHTTLSRAYEQATGEALRSLPYFEVLGLYKMAVITAGWVGGGHGAGMWYGLGLVQRRLEQLLGPRWDTR